MSNVTGDSQDSQEPLFQAFAAKRGHFAYESGYHRDLFLNLDKVVGLPYSLVAAIDQLSQQVATLKPNCICRCLTGGAFVAFAVASKLSVRSFWSSRAGRDAENQLYPFHYRIEGDIEGLSNKRVVVIDDVVNAGSAVRSTLASIRKSGMKVVGLASLLTIGSGATELCQQENLRLLTLARIQSQIWEPQNCPLCALGEPAMDVT